ncbi:1268_t:CDS:2, partial [Funneliformis caledonium]
GTYFSSNYEYLQILCEELNQIERQKLARRYLRNFEAITEEEEIIIEMFKELIDNEQSSFIRNYVAEDTHTIRNITPIILNLSLKIIKELPLKANKMLESSTIAKRRFDSEHLDLISLGKMMTCAIDKSIKDSAYDLVICGMQVIGKYILVLGKSLCDGPPVRRDLLHDINWRVRASKGFHIMGYCLAVLLSLEHNLINNGVTSYQTAIRMNKQSKSSMMIKPMFHSPTK